MTAKSSPSSPAIELDISSISIDGDGIALYRGQPIAVPYTIPGERVRIAPPRRTDAGGVAMPLAILRPSPHRVVPRCRHFGVEMSPLPGEPADRSQRGDACGGCTWQHIAYGEQLRLKTRMIDDIARSAIAGAPPARPTLAATAADDPWGYRHKVHFVFAQQRPPRGRPRPVMGHYVRQSRRVFPARECPVHDPRGNAMAFALRDAYVRSGADGSTLKSVAIRTGAHTGELMTTLVVADDGDKAVRAATRRVIDAQRPTAFHLNVHPKSDAYIFGRQTRRIAGTERLRDEVAGVAFLMSPTAFFQTNVAAAELLVREVLAAVPAGADVLDLYAGAGLFALPLAKAGHRVVAVEENREAVADGEAARALNRIAADRCRFVARRVEAALPAMTRADVVVLDPPREGCAPAVIDGTFGRLRPRRAIYISCNPVALGRDLQAITALGYAVASLQPVDMFPHTAHIETVAVLDGLRR